MRRRRGTRRDPSANRHGARRARIVGSLVVGTVVAVGVAAVAPSDPTPAAAQTQPEAWGEGCTSSSSTMPLLLPAWSDQSGWSSASQYGSILTADIDGDGTDELVGRNGLSLDVEVWGQPYQAGATVNSDWTVNGLPAPGQWLPDQAPSAPAQEDIYFDPSTYSTMQPANLDSDPAQEIIARTYDGLQVFDYLPGPGGTPGTWWTPVASNVFADAFYTGPWWESPYYSTITTGDVSGNDGIDEVIGRGPFGIQTYAYQSSAFVQIDANQSPQDPVMPDGEFWNQPQYYETIRVGDIDGDTGDELVARGEDGLAVWSFSDSSGTWTLESSTGPWTDTELGGGWKDDASWYSTIALGDLNGDGVEDIYGRTEYGLDAWTYTGGTWSELVTPPTSGSPSVLADATPGTDFSQPQYYETIQTARLNGESGPDSILARSAAGVGFYSVSGGAFTGPTLTSGQFSDANEWDQPVRYETISTATVAGEPILLGKDASGMRTCQLDAGATSWTSPSATYPAWSLPGANPSAPPAGYDPTLWQQQVSAWNYINSQCSGSPAYLCASGGTLFDLALADQTSMLPASPTIGIGQSKVLNWYANQLDPPAGLNIPSDVWDGVYNQGFTWLYDIANVQNFFFGTTNGGNLSQLIVAVQLTSNTPASLADAYFGGSGNQIQALIADLLRAATPAIGFYSGTAESILYITGASVAASTALDNPTGEIDTTAAELQAELNAQFQDSADFLASSYLQIVQDAGLLGAMGQMTIEGPLFFTDGSTTYQPPAGSIAFTDAATVAENASNLWVWQQLAAGGSGGSGGWTVGYCSAVVFTPSQEGQCHSDFNTDVNNGNGVYYNSGKVLCPGNDPDGDQCYVGYKYRVSVGNECDSDSKGVSGYQELNSLQIGFDPDQLFMPRQQEARISSIQADPKGYQLPLPIHPDGSAGGGRMGILGWRVVPNDCDR